MKIVLFIVILILTLPSAYDNFRVYFASLDSSALTLTSSYFKAMQFLEKKGNYNQTFIEIPDKNISATQNDLMRWYRSSMPGIVTFANKRSYLSNEYIDFTGLDYKSRIAFIRKIVIFNNLPMNNSLEYINLQKEIRQGLRNNKVVFIYSPYSLNLLEEMKYVYKIYENQATFIYEVDIK